MKKYVSLYVHIPFCAAKCKYCDFLSFDGENYTTMLRYVDSLCQEIKMYSGIIEDYVVRSIFIGGGTPSLLDEGFIVNIMSFIKKYFKVLKNAEITIEANPGTLKHQKLVAYKTCGINRISIGLQSADDELLHRLGRIHNYDQFVASYNAARRAGFNNINVDIMSGLPGQTIRSYVDTLTKVMEYAPEHISAYSLIVEEGTPFAEDKEIQELLPSEVVDRRMYEVTKTLLGANGYDRYEISNYAKEGCECIHNMIYWTGGEYIGLGLGASSYFQGKRFDNLRSIEEYISIMDEFSQKSYDTSNREQLYIETTRKLRKNTTPIYIDSRMEEFMFLGLRMTCGVSREDFKERFNKDIYEVYGQVINHYIDQGLMATDSDRIFLTDKGIDVSNVILADFLLD